jgi:hypothetical protein
VEAFSARLRDHIQLDRLSAELLAVVVNKVLKRGKKGKKK